MKFMFSYIISVEISQKGNEVMQMGKKLESVALCTSLIYAIISWLLYIDHLYYRYGKLTFSLPH